MTARFKVVRKSTPAQPSGTSSVTPRPKNPRVDQGPKGYGRTKNGKYVVVIRFFVGQLPRRSSTRWWVFDIEEDTNQGIARGTKTQGYGSQEEAIAVARQYRDEYGPYGKAPF